ncbi:putative GPI-anchor transamidase [Kockovaella imperatae]|uniref:Putative GPI-anchor transamidase n=1 Tax=Kockovaella imperatae TaxID=4999 RepID=A0A1Y1UDH0_9TREE|nr:putative GPI-anchor transamidase [Kockovaella imperatae]ORX35566.1 putative GPI-anchor transamidase [Kockovaella imperatae]
MFRQRGPSPDRREVNYTREHVAIAKTIRRRRRVVRWINRHLGGIRALLFGIGVVWILALPLEALWRGTYVDEHALQPNQVNTYWDWSNVHRADRYLDELEQMVNSTQAERSDYLQRAFSASGHDASNTSTSTYAHVQPPRSNGLEVILVSANWMSRESKPNLRGVAILLALADFLRGQNYWANDLVLVVGEGYLDGLEGFMQEYYDRFNGVIWTALNVDYPGHSFEHIGLFYEGLNGRLPNQDVINSVAQIARWSGGVTTRMHDIEEQGYIGAARHLLNHAAYSAFGRASGAHGVLAKHRIDAITLYCPNATGPHGFYTLGKTIESTLRSFNNLLERLHASYFFYLIPRSGKFIPVGHYLPAAILLGASVTLGGFDCPDPVQGLIWTTPVVAITILGWVVQSPLVTFLAVAAPKPQGTARRSFLSLCHLFFGALIPTLAMVNFPQAIALAFITSGHLAPWRWVRWIMVGLNPALLGSDLRREWETLGNLTWVGIMSVWVPLGIVAAM